MKAISVILALPTRTKFLEKLREMPWNFCKDVKNFDFSTRTKISGHRESMLF
jgi:hypothetical protein